MPWTGPQELKAQVQRLWDRGVLLAALLDDSLEFPLRLRLNRPTSRELTDDFQSAREWISQLRQINGVRIESRTFHHRILGENTVPDTAWLDSLEDAISMLRKESECEQFALLATQTRERNPAILCWVQKWPLKALALAPQWPRLLDIICWLQDNPRPDCYLRQVSLPGIDSKFVEQHRAALTPLLDLSLPPKSIDQGSSGLSGFARRYGFRAKPVAVRFRVLDSRLALLPGQDRDISLTSGDFRELDAGESFSGIVRQVFITENEINFLAFPAVENALVIFGAGYGFDAIRDVPWLDCCEIFYWGDIDTHGFAILDQLRQSYPQVRSFLMNEATLLAHRAHWGNEGSSESRCLQRLNPQEHRLYQDLQENRFGERLRLEQERIDYNFLLAHLPSEAR